MLFRSTLTHVEEHLLREIVEIAGEASPERILRKANASIKRLLPNLEVKFSVNDNHQVLPSNYDGATKDEFEYIALVAQTATFSISNSKSTDLANRLQIYEERLRIARDLHDRVLQRIFATGISLEGALRKAVVGDVIEALKQALVDLDETVNQIRSTVHSLKGPVSSIRQRLLTEIEGSRATWKLIIDFKIHGPIDLVVPEEMHDDLVAVTTELLSNCGKHSNSGRAKYELIATGNSLEISVSNTSEEFKPFKFGHGLENLSARAARYSGELIVDNLEPGLRVSWKVAL